MPLVTAPAPIAAGPVAFSASPDASRPFSVVVAAAAVAALVVDRMMPIAIESTTIWDIQEDSRKIQKKRAPPNEIDGENQLLIFALRERARGGTHRTTHAGFFIPFTFSHLNHMKKKWKKICFQIYLSTLISLLLWMVISPLYLSQSE